jgi:hypothetical protein
VCRDRFSPPECRVCQTDGVSTNSSSPTPDLALSALIAAVEAADLQGIRLAVQQGADVNARCDDGASLLFGACLSADCTVVKQLLDLGADPNLLAEDPAASMYAETPFELVLQAQIVSSWEKYTPVYDLLVAYGARDIDGLDYDDETNERRRATALEWQAPPATDDAGGANPR